MNKLGYSYNTRQLRSQTRFSHSGTALMDRVLQYDPNGNLIAIDSTASGTGCAVNDTIVCSRFESDSTPAADNRSFRSEEHTSELQSRGQLVRRLLPEKKTA